MTLPASLFRLIPFKRLARSYRTSSTSWYPHLRIKARDLAKESRPIGWLLALACGAGTEVELLLCDAPPVWSQSKDCSACSTTNGGCPSAQPISAPPPELAATLSSICFSGKGLAFRSTQSNNSCQPPIFPKQCFLKQRNKHWWACTWMTLCPGHSQK